VIYRQWCLGKRLSQKKNHDEKSSERSAKRAKWENRIRYGVGCREGRAATSFLQQVLRCASTEQQLAGHPTRGGARWSEQVASLSDVERNSPRCSCYVGKPYRQHCVSAFAGGRLVDLMRCGYVLVDGLTLSSLCTYMKSGFTGMKLESSGTLRRTRWVWACLSRWLHSRIQNSAFSWALTVLLCYVASFCCQVEARNGPHGGGQWLTGSLGTTPSIKDTYEPGWTALQPLPRPEWPPLAWDVLEICTQSIMTRAGLPLAGLHSHLPCYCQNVCTDCRKISCFRETISCLSQNVTNKMPELDFPLFELPYNKLVSL